MARKSAAEQVSELAATDIEAIKEDMLPQDDVEVTAEFFKAFSDPTRINIVNALQLHEWLCVTDLASIVGVSKSALSHQLSYLRLNKLVKVKREGRNVYYSLSDDHVEKVFALAISHIRE
ncbi:MAG TPA: transcriptional regulator [Succinivibrionaceae bacterium]|nr:helix-turn-helix transcriptional regulator [Succinivibrio sp.]HAR79900.1 transcriptional regulator [Succinivibrionaceae bacterium]